jgi:glycosyltransferase involved in cell wall biosynthesis
MITIGLDTSGLSEDFREHAARGIGRYVAELHKYFTAHPDPEVAVVPFDHARFVASARWNDLIDRVPLGRRTIKQQLIAPLRLSLARGLPFDVMHFPAHMDAPSWCWRRYILTVLDLIPLVLKELYQAELPGWRFKLARRLEIRAIEQAGLVLAISENTARDVERLLGVPADRIVVTPLGVAEKFFGARLGEDETGLRLRYGIPAGRPIILYVGGIDPRKNWRGMLAVLCELLSKLQAFPLRAKPVLVMAGKITTDRQYPKLLAEIGRLGLEADVILPGFVKDEDLLQLYAVSAVFLFLSLYEGFGLPPLEAMAAGLPVVCSNRSSLPEVIGDAALLVDPEDHGGVLSALWRILEEPELAADLRARGRKQATRFTWEQTGAATLAAYRRLLKGAHA